MPSRCLISRLVAGHALVQAAVEEAMVILKQAYDALGMKELSDSATRVLQANFPNSPYLSGKVKKNVPWWRIWDPDW